MSLLDGLGRRFRRELKPVRATLQVTDSFADVFPTIGDPGAGSRIEPVRDVALWTGAPLAAQAVPPVRGAIPMGGTAPLVASDGTFPYPPNEAAETPWLPQRDGQLPSDDREQEVRRPTRPSSFERGPKALTGTPPGIWPVRALRSKVGPDLGDDPLGDGGDVSESGDNGAPLADDIASQIEVPHAGLPFQALRTFRANFAFVPVMQLTPQARSLVLVASTVSELQLPDGTVAVRFSWDSAINDVYVSLNGAAEIPSATTSGNDYPAAILNPCRDWLYFTKNIRAISVISAFAGVFNVQCYQQAG